MIRRTLFPMTVALLFATSLATTAGAVATPEQNCQKARAQAWGRYQQCVENVAGKLYSGTTFDVFKAFWTCRHTYSGNWTKFQTRMSLQGSSCDTGIGNRFTDNADGTVTDNLSGLTWEKKTNKDDTPNLADIHDADNLYTWTTGSPNRENGTAFSAFLAGGTGLNPTGFAGANGWRLPTLAELQTIQQDFSCKGAGGSATCICTGPCIAFNDSNTNAVGYWTSTTYAPFPDLAWVVGFGLGVVTNGDKTDESDVRAVRGGL